MKCAELNTNNLTFRAKVKIISDIVCYCFEWINAKMREMKLFKVVLLALLVGSVSTEVTCAKSNTLTQKQLERYKPLKANEGRKLMSLTKAKLKDVHLAKHVKYFDIKQYDNYKKYVGGLSFDMTAYKNLSSKDKKKIRSARPVKPHDPFWKVYLLDGVESGYYNLHYINKDSRFHTITTRKKLLAFLGRIDTPTELSILFLGRTVGKIGYKKIGDLYIMRIHELSFTDCDGCGEPACILFVRHMIMDNRGNILLDKQISEQSFKSEKQCSKL
jgi:hypothetical protein